MKTRFYAVRFQATRFIATEVEPDEAAALLDAGRNILLADPNDLLRVALRHHKTLSVDSRDAARSASQVGAAALAASPRGTTSEPSQQDGPQDPPRARRPIRAVPTRALVYRALERAVHAVHA